jgi:hypothetical protein
MKIRTEDKVASGSEKDAINLVGIGRKQMGQSSFAGGSLNSASSRSSATRSLQSALCSAKILLVIILLH